MFERTLSGALGPYFAQIKQIGAGGNGRVLSAIDTRFDFPVCIKRISTANKDECRATLREIRIRRRLQHENIVGLLNAIVSDGTDVAEISPANFRDTSCIYLVQELLDADLRQVIETTRLSDEYVKLFYYQLLRGLKYIHSANILHRDLKPSNIMVNVNSLQLMIGDFGNSMVLDPEYNHGNSQTICATSLWYKAPELILGSAEYSTMSDIWAVGCILAEMLLGRPLFEAENELEQLELIIHAIEVNQKDQIYVREYLPEKANTMYTGLPKFPLQSKFQKVDPQALYLLKRLLSFNANERVTAEEALSNPFLNEYSCVTDEPVCLKPLHLEHEVDDFLEYTLKDLIVGECVLLAEEQPHIHLQMSSYCSLTDIAKECNKSPCESSSQSMDDCRGLTVSEDYSEASNESEGNRFKVLEVLKEEHGSSSDSNGLAVHEEGVSEAPLVQDHPMFSSSRLDKERLHHGHKSAHRSRHHSHHKSRRRKVSRDEKHQLKSPSSELERPHDSIHSPRGSLPEILLPGDDILRINGAEIPVEEVIPMVEVNCPESTVQVYSSATTSSQSTTDDKVQELIMRNRVLIAEQTGAVNGVPAINDVCSSVASKVDVPMEIGDELSKVETPLSSGVLTKLSYHGSLVQLGSSKVGGLARLSHHKSDTDLKDSKFHDDLTKLSYHRSSVDLGVEEVVRRSQELLGETYSPNAGEVRSCITGDATAEIDSIPEHSPCVADEKSFANYPPPFTEIPSDPITGSPQTNNHQPSTAYHPPPHPIPYQPDTISNTLQPMLSDPYHLKESNRRMQELLAESHTLLNSLKTDQMLFPDISSGSPITHVLQPEQSSCKVDEEKSKLLKHTFDQSLDGGDLREMSIVLDQAKKLLEKSNELSEDFIDKQATVDDMDLDENIDGKKKIEGQSTETDMESNDGDSGYITIEKVDLKEVAHLQQQVDLVCAVSGPASERATILEAGKVKFCPLLEQQTLRLNSYSRSSKDNKTSNIKENESEDLEQIDVDSVFENSNFQIEKDVVVKKRSNEVNEDNNHKHFKNCTVLLPVSAADSLEENRKGNSKEHCKKDDSKRRLNGIINLDLNVEKRLLDNTNCKIDLAKLGKHSPKYETATLRNGDTYVNRVIEDDVVDKLCGTTCRMENSTKRLNLKDSAGLQNFYATLKIKSIMQRNRTRANREKRHDTYPF